MQKEISGLVPWVLLVVGLAAFWFFARGEKEATAQEVVLRSYEVPEGRAEELARVLASAMPRDGEKGPIARITASPDGRVLVAGPRTIQPGVERVLAEAAKSPSAGPPPTVEMTYWLVHARSAEKPGDVGPELKEVAPALETIAKTDGSMEFELLERLRLASMSDEHASGQGGRVDSFFQRATVAGGKIIADLKIDPEGSAQIQTRVQLLPDQFLVLGESAIRDPKEPDTRLYYIVRPSIRG